MRRGLLQALLSVTLLAACGHAPPALDPAAAAAEAAHRGHTAPPAAAAGTVELVESAPIETTLEHPDILHAHDVWPIMIQGATRTLDIAQFYVENAPGSRLEPVLQAIEAAADRGVAVRLLVDAGFAKRYHESLDRLAARRGITVRRFDVRAVMGGVLHAKYFIVDGREAYIGSQNFDWRSLTHIQEMGVRVRDPAVTAAYAEVFDMDWALAAGETPPPAASLPRSFPEIAAGQPATVTPVASPKGFLPDRLTWELPKIVELIDGAKKSVHVQVLTYKAAARDGSPFHELDEALRRAAARGVQVEVLLSDWEKRHGMIKSALQLARVPGISVRFLDVPAWSGGYVAYARVAHAKYMVVDGARAWVGTSNWEGDYFTKTRNVGILVEGDAFAAQLERVFRDGFAGPYAEVVDPDKEYEPPRTGE